LLTCCACRARTVCASCSLHCAGVLRENCSGPRFFVDLWASCRGDLPCARAGRASMALPRLHPLTQTFTVSRVFDWCCSRRDSMRFFHCHASTPATTFSNVPQKGRVIGDETGGRGSLSHAVAAKLGHGHLVSPSPARLSAHCEPLSKTMALAAARALSVASLFTHNTHATC